MLVALMPASASAHRPWFNTGGTPDPHHPYRLTELNVSQVIYSGFDQGDQVDYYGFTADVAFFLDVRLVVPDVPACAAFRPALALIGPGLSAPDAVTPAPGNDAASAGLAVLSRSSESGLLVATSSRWGTFFEPFTGTTYATGPHVQRLLTGGDYLVAVYAPDRQIGTYGLSLGGTERGGGDAGFQSRIAPYTRCTPPERAPATPVAAS